MALGKDNFIKRCARLRGLIPVTTKVFLTSRTVPRIQKALKRLYVSPITLGQYLVDQDVVIFIKHRLANSPLGANPGHADNDGTTALHLFSKHLASSKKAEFYFGKLLSLGIPIDGRTSRGESPLFFYITHSTHYLKHLPLFTNAGADFFAINHEGQNFLHSVLSQGRL